MKTTMKFCALFLGALGAYGQTVSLSDTLANAVGGGSFTGRITVTLNAPGNASPPHPAVEAIEAMEQLVASGAKPL